MIVNVLVVTCQCGQAMFMPYETKKVPVERIFKNLQMRQRQNTNDFEVTYQLARLHSMAYATKLVEVNVRTKDETPVFYSPRLDSGVPRTVRLPETAEIRQAGFQHLTNAILLYERAIALLKKSTNVNERESVILPIELGRAWCLDQAGRRKEALEAYRRTLKIAWKMEVTGNFDIKQWIKEVWDDMRSGSNAIHGSRRREYIGPGVCYSQEIIGYLLKLLDPLKDAKEIDQLKKDQQTLRSMGRMVTPIIVPLDWTVSLAELADATATVTFDLDGSGLPRQWGWITSKAAWLVFDSDGSGEITSALQMFGNVTFWIFWRDGYDALAALDEDCDGVLRGAELRGLALWHDRNGNGVSEPGEVRPLAAFGITAISCKSETHSSGIQWSSRGVTLRDGTTRPTYDWIAPSRPVEVNR